MQRSSARSSNVRHVAVVRCAKRNSVRAWNLATAPSTTMAARLTYTTSRRHRIDDGVACGSTIEGLRPFDYRQHEQIRTSTSATWCWPGSMSGRALSREAERRVLRPTGVASLPPGLLRLQEH
jgi:hypothetical protein